MKVPSKHLFKINSINFFILFKIFKSILTPANRPLLVLYRLSACDDLTLESGVPLMLDLIPKDCSANDDIINFNTTTKSPDLEVSHKIKKSINLLIKRLITT